ncbi:MAG: hypothetical protein ACJ76Z_03290 [Thermoleophilaceae bacterium]
MADLRVCRTAVLAAMLTAAGLPAGCGGSGGGTTGSLTQPGQVSLKEVRAKEAPARSHVPARRRSHALRHRAPARKTPGAALPAAQQIMIVKQIAPGIVEGLGFGKADVATDGRTATIGVLPAKACAMGPSGPADLQKRLSASLPFVTSVAVVVTGTKQALRSYATSHCHAASPPPATGAVVLYANGAEGMVTTKRFHVRSAKWTISYTTEGKFFQLFVVKAGAVQPNAIAATKPGAGRRTIRGAGSFALQITASAAWRVQVHDGA